MFQGSEDHVYSRVMYERSQGAEAEGGVRWKQPGFGGEKTVRHDAVDAVKDGAKAKLALAFCLEIVETWRSEGAKGNKMRPVQRIDVTPAAGVNCTPLAPSSPALADFAIHASATAASRARVAALLALIMPSPGGRVSRILVPALLRRVLLSHRTP